MDRDREKKRERKLAIGFVVTVIIIVVLLVAFATQPASDNGFEPDSTAFRVGQTTIEYNNTSGWWVYIPIIYGHDCYVYHESYDCTTVKFVFDIELAGGGRDNWTTEALSLPYVAEGYEDQMEVKLLYTDREPVSVSLKEILCA